MIKAIIFDFDGVIIESADIKTEAFRELFSDYPQSIKKIIDYHLANAGISRYVKFRYICENFLGQDISKDKEMALGRDFSQIVIGKLLSAPFVDGAKEFLDDNKERYEFFIASGTPQEELHNIVRLKGLHKYFKEIHGSPDEKEDIINNILDRHLFIKDEVVYIGDAQSDRIAAEKAGVVFIERRAGSDSKSGSYPWLIEDLRCLGETLKKMETANLKERG